MLLNSSNSDRVILQILLAVELQSSYYYYLKKELKEHVCTFFFYLMLTFPIKTFCLFFLFIMGTALQMLSASSSVRNLEWAPKCPCGYGYMILKTSRTTQNLGRRFWKCPDLHVSVYRLQLLKLICIFTQKLIFLLL